MKKILATFLLLMSVSVVFAGKAVPTDGAIEGRRPMACHDKDGKWNPQDKNCDRNSCGCLFHQIEEFLMDIFG